MKAEENYHDHRVFSTTFQFKYTLQSTICKSDTGHPVQIPSLGYFLF